MTAKVNLAEMTITFTALLVALVSQSGCQTSSDPLSKAANEKKPSAVKPINFDVVKAEMNLLELINEYRRKSGSGNLTLSPALKRSAQWLSDDISAKDYFNHRDSAGRGVAARIASFGYRAPHVGENIAIANDPEGALYLWKHSPSHNANMLDGKYRVVGIGIAVTPQGIIWTTDFGSD